MLLIKEQRNYMKTKSCYICYKKIENKCLKNKKYLKLEIIVIIQGNIKVLRVAYVI